MRKRTLIVGTASATNRRLWVDLGEAEVAAGETSEDKIVVQIPDFVVEVEVLVAAVVLAEKVVKTVNTIRVKPKDPVIGAVLIKHAATTTSHGELNVTAATLQKMEMETLLETKRMKEAVSAEAVGAPLTGEVEVLVVEAVIGAVVGLVTEAGVDFAEAAGEVSGQVQLLTLVPLLVKTKKLLLIKERSKRIMGRKG